MGSASAVARLCMCITEIRRHTLLAQDAAVSTSWHIWLHVDHKHLDFALGAFIQISGRRALSAHARMELAAVLCIAWQGI